MTDYSDLPDEMTSAEYLLLMGGGGAKSTHAQTRPSLGAGQKRKPANDWAGQLFNQFQLLGIPEPIKEYRFHPERKWRFDGAWVEQKLAVEIDGGVYGREVYCNHCGGKVTRTLKDGRTISIREGGRHNTGQGFEEDRRKWAAAVALGWRIIGITSGMIEDGSGAGYIMQALGLTQEDTHK